MRIAFITLGCDKNRVDTEKMMALTFGESPHVLVTDPRAAELTIINTCGFLAAARAELENLLDELNPSPVVLTGCVLPLLSTDFFERHPNVVGTLPSADLTHLPNFLTHPSLRPWRTGEGKWGTSRLLSTYPYAYLKIADGCNHACSYCLIPQLRGRYRSYSWRGLVTEARELVASGIKEIILVAQDTTWYGKDRYQDFRLEHLLRKLLALPGDFKIRLLYTYLNTLSPAVVDLMTHPKFCHYLDLPLQHVAPAILKAMRRPPAPNLEQQLVALRTKLPDLTLRTTFITGFPGETSAEFNQLLTFVQKGYFDHVGVFPYSPEPGTAAARLPLLPEKERIKRADQLLQTQTKVLFTKNQARVGQVTTLLVDEEIKPNRWVGRNDWFAPEVDGLIYLTAKKLTVGTWHQVKITRAEGYDLEAELLS